MTEPEELIAIYRAALQAVDPYRLMQGVDLSQAPSFLLALGKAAEPMARAALEQRAFERALVVGPGPPDARRLANGTRYIRMQGAHPVPDQRSLEAGQAILELAARAREGMLVLLSGGGSALAEVPQGELTLAQLQETTRALLAAGAPIERVNAVRRHLSRLKGGRLAEITTCHTLALSDVLGSPPEAIASGPTAPDPTTVQDALEACRGLAIPERVRAAFRETPKPGDPCFAPCTYRILADNRTLLEKARQELGAQVLTDRLEGEAREVARELARQPPGRWVASGEPTVTLRGEPGRGGRCQELALAFALAAEGRKARLLAAGSDGIDGDTDAAGAVVDGQTCARARALGLDPERHLLCHDAYPLLDAVGALLKPGATGTNTNDLFLLHVER